MIKTIPMRNVVILVVMLVAAGLAAAAKPRTKVADLGPKVDLETMIPKQFGQWSVDESIVPVAPSPEAKALLDRIYNQTLSRTYRNNAGDRVMLSIAYGGDQSDSMQVHKPEVCYAAQGFGIMKVFAAQFASPFGPLPVKRLVAVQGARTEPITYWITVGDQATSSGTQAKLAQLKYGLTGKVPDGMLVRVSSIDRDESRAYGIQGDFLGEMLKVLDREDRLRIAGALVQ